MRARTHPNWRTESLDQSWGSQKVKIMREDSPKIDLNAGDVGRAAPNTAGDGARDAAVECGDRWTCGDHGSGVCFVQTTDYFYYYSLFCSSSKMLWFRDTRCCGYSSLLCCQVIWSRKGRAYINLNNHIFKDIMKKDTSSRSLNQEIQITNSIFIHSSMKTWHLQAI